MTLTEQWKAGELEKRRRYYVRDGEKIFTSYLDEHNCFLQSREEDTYQEYEEYTTYCDEVLAPVPSYEEWQELSKQRNQLIRDVKDLAYIQEENQQLKELLYSLKCCLTSENIEPQIRVEKSLAKIDNVIGEKK